MNKREVERRLDQRNRLFCLGFSYDEAETLRRISNALHSWYERECNEDIRRHEEGPRAGKLFGVRQYQGWDGKWKESRYPIRDMESGAVRRLEKILANHPEFTYYLQTDPRGAALYLIPLSRVSADTKLDSVYSSIGICIF